jgi:hypothetical protein
MIAPRTGAPEVAVGEEQHEFKPVTAAIYGDNREAGPVTLLTRWRPTQEELRLLLGGEDLYVALRTYGHPMQPLLVQVGPAGWKGEQ